MVFCDRSGAFKWRSASASTPLIRCPSVRTLTEWEALANEPSPERPLCVPQPRCQATAVKGCNPPSGRATSDAASLWRGDWGNCLPILADRQLRAGLPARCQLTPVSAYVMVMVWPLASYRADGPGLFSPRDVSSPGDQVADHCPLILPASSPGIHRGWMSAIRRFPSWRRVGLFVVVLVFPCRPEPSGIDGLVCRDLARRLSWCPSGGLHLGGRSEERAPLDVLHPWSRRALVLNPARSACRGDDDGVIGAFQLCADHGRRRRRSWRISEKAVRRAQTWCSA